ncbi:MAG: T9SS type A sorting domain-containing protein, partial [Candidatus Latescibacterota bacterium]
MCDGHTWYMFRLDSVFTASHGPRTGPVPDAYCIDINDHYFANGDTIWFFFGAKNMVGQWSYWSTDAGTVSSMGEACAAPLEMQILPGEGVANGGDILYVDYFSGRGAQPYFDSAFELLGLSEEIDRFDKRGPSSLVGNGLAFHATLMQLVDNYRAIIWNSGDLSVGTVGDGSSDKSNDYEMLYNFLDQHTQVNGCGIYFSGDDLAEELDGMTSASSQQFKGVYMPHTFISGDHTTLHRVSPLGIGEGINTGTPPSIGLFDGDTLIAYGGCPTLNDFDVIAPAGSATLEMCYDPANEADDSNPAIIANAQSNSNGNLAAVVLSGFSFHSIRDDKPQDAPDRAYHLIHILRYMAAALSDPTEVKPGWQYTNSLAQNYPNPFNPVTTIEYSVRERGHVSLKIYNVAGRLVRTLVNSEMNPGAYAERWDGRSNAGTRVASGVYFYKITGKNFSKTKKMLLLK